MLLPSKKFLHVLILVLASHLYGLFTFVSSNMKAVKLESGSHLISHFN
jgi:hypothetical protein